MTRIPSKIGAVSLAALVVLSVVAGTVAFTGPAAAVSSIDPTPGFSPGEISESEQQQHSFNYTFTGVNTSGDATVSLSVPGEFSIDSVDVEVKNETGTVLSNTTTTPNDNSVELTTTEPTSTLYFDGTVEITAPEVDADTDRTIKINATDGDGQTGTSSTLTVINDPLEVDSTSFSPTQVDQETETRYTLNTSFTGVNKSDDTTYSIAVPSEFDIEGWDLTVENATGTELTNTVQQSGNTLELTTSSDTERTYLNGTLNLTSPTVPEGSEEATYDLTVGASENGRSDEVTQTITVDYVGGQPGDPEFLSATQFVQSDGTPAIEVAFSEDIQNFGSNYGLYVDEEEVTGDIVTNVDESQGRVVIELDDTDSRDLTLRLESGIVDSSGNTLSNLNDPEYKPITFAPTSVRASGSVNAYSGSTVSIVASSSNTDITLQGTEDDTDNYFFEGSTGTNSRVFRFDTGGEEIGDYEADIQGEGTASITIRDLDLSLDIEDRNVTTLQSIEGTVSGRVGGREIQLELLDDNGDVVDERRVDLSGQGERDFSYDIESLELETGEYTVRATDTASGVSVESDAITVREAGDTEALLPNDVISEQRGDVVAIPIELRNTREVTLTVGDDQAGYQANVTVREDQDDADGQVTVYFNSWEASNVGTGSFSGANDLFSVDDEAEVVRGDVSIGVSNLLDAEAYPLSVDTEGRETDIQLLSLEERNTTAIRTWTAPRDRYSDLDNAEDVYEGTTDEWLTRDTDVAVGDTIVYEVQASGLEGALDAHEEDTVTTEFFDFADGRSNPAALFSVEEEDPGPNQDPLLLELNGSNSRVVADSANDTYYVITRTGDSGPEGVEDADGDGVIDPSENDYGSTDADSSLQASFTVYGDDENDFDLTADGEDETVETSYSLTTAEFEMSDPFNVTEVSGQEIFGETTLAPGTEVNVRVRSADGVRPAFLKTATTTVDTDGQFLVTLSFNNTNPGDRYSIVVNDVGGPASELTVEGTVQPVIQTPTTNTPAETTTTTSEPTTSTTTTEPTTSAAPTTEIPTVQTPTTTPGFGVLAALVALAGAALLALRRE